MTTSWLNTAFFLDRNEWDAIYLDDIIFRDLTTPQKEELCEQQYDGNYQLTSHGVCFRTEVAACMKYMTPTDWQNYILGISTRGIDAMRTNAIIRGWVTTYLQEANEMIALLEKTRTDREENTHVDMELVGNEDERITDNIRLEMLLVRWYQIRKLCEDAVQALG